MSGIILVVLIFFGLAAGLGAVAYFTYQRKLRRAKAIERGLKMVPVLIHLPPSSSDTAAGSRDVREVMREKTAQAEVLYNLIAGTVTDGFKSKFYGQRHIALELVAINGIVHFYAAVPVALVSVVEKAIQTAYPGARMEETEDYNIFNQDGRLAATLGGEMVLRADSAYPVATYAKLERDPMEALLTTISALEKKDGVAVQIMLRPAPPSWTKRSIALADNKRKGRKNGLKFSAMDLAKAAVKAPSQQREEERARLGGASEVSNLQLSEVESIEEKTKHPGFEVLIRVIVSTSSVARSQQLLRDIATGFALFEAPGMNGFKFLPAVDVQGLVTAFIFRFFPPELKSNILNSVELATLFHLPDSQFTPSRSIERQQSKQVDGPVHLSSEGLMFGYNDFRGVEKEIRLSTVDRRRHTYILGQTGTGKSTMLENLAVQDMQSGGGFAFIDPHGDSAEKLLSMVPKERAEDVIYFNPSDSQYPLGLNLFEFNDPAQKDFLVQETINMLYKLYDPGHTGIIGPRYEHWYRNAALTLMSDPNGATFIEIPKVFTDTEYLKQKFKYLRDPTVIDFWTKEMGQTSDYHKSEMLGWFVSKFGAFQNNEMMRNIIGQTKSSFNMRDVMDKKKILIVNLSKGRIGELNSQLLGMIFVIKFQAAAMSRADTPEDQRPDFSLYVDEFQNFSTDSFASILSEARKYRLNVIVANQFIGQLSDEIRDAVFGNIGTIVAHRMGPEDAEFMVKQFAPVFDTSDLINIPNYNAAMRLMIGGLPSQPFSIRNLGPLGTPNLELGLAIKQLSAAKFGHAKAVVEADIMERFTGHSGPATLPPAVGDPTTAAAPAPSPAPAPAPAPLPPPVPAPLPPPVPVPAPVPLPPAPVAQPVVPVSMPAPVAAVAVAPVSAAPITLPAPAPVSAPVDVAAAMPAPVASASSVPMSAAVALPAPVLASPPPAPALQGMVIAPPPIGAAPVDLPEAALAANTTSQPMISMPGIIPEDNIAAEADQMAQAGGFTQLGAPLAPANGAAPPANLAVAQPLIGAPPVAAVPEPEPESESGPPGPPQAPGLAVEPAPASQSEPVALVPTSSPTPSLLVTAPPPIGAPPVDLPSDAMPIPVPALLPAATAAARVGTLSLADITGGKSLPQTLDLPAIAQLPIEEVPLLAEPAPGQPPTPMQAPIAPYVPLGSGEPLPNDPYANIDVLGDLTPPPMMSMTVEPGAGEGMVPEPADAPMMSGEPLAGDPYAGIDVLGTAADSPILASSNQALAPTTISPRSVEAAPEIALEEPEPIPEIAPVLQPPEGASKSQAPVSMAPMPVPLAQRPQLQVVPVVEQPQPVLQPTIAPLPRLEPAPLPEPQEHILDTTMPEPEPREAAPVAIREPEPREPGVVATSPELVSVPVSVSASAQAPMEPPLPDEPLIHFVDPTAQALLDSPDLPDAVIPQNDEPSLNGLPEGVHILPPAPVSQPVPAAIPEPEPASVSVPVPIVAAAPLPPLASFSPTLPSLAPIVPQPEEPPIAMVAELANMAVAPPPIGAAPVALAPASSDVAAAVMETPVIPKEAPGTPVPELNVSLAEVLEEAPLPPVLQPRLTSKDHDSAVNDPLESVSQMLEEVHRDSDSLAAKPVEPIKPVEPEGLSTPEPPKVEPAMTPEPPVIVDEPRPEAEDAPVEPAVESKPVALTEMPTVPERMPSPTVSSRPEATPPVLQPEHAVTGSTAAAQIEKAEHEIDELLSVSLIHSDASASHRRLPEPVEPRSTDGEGSLDEAMNAKRPATTRPSGAPEHLAEHHGLKVIQPLEPIVPPKEKFAQELAALNNAVSTPENMASTALLAAPHAVEPVKLAAAVPQQARPIIKPEIKPEPKLEVKLAPKPKPAPQTVVVKHAGEMLAPVPEPMSQMSAPAFDDEVLPQAESLAADDVARVRAEHEAQAVMQKSEPQPEPERDSEPNREPKEHEAPEETSEEPETRAVEQPKLAEATDERANGKRKRRRGSRADRPAEHIESEEEAEHNKPSEAAEAASTLTGKLILPTGEKPTPEPAQPKTEKPKKLAPGEIYVDESGNVVIGE